MGLDSIPIVTEPAEARLHAKQLLDYREHREAFISWLQNEGKDPDDEVGYSRATVVKTAYRTDQFNRWVWSHEDRYTTSITHDHAEAYMKELATSEKSNTHNANTQKALRRFFKWDAHERGGDEWETDRSFSSSSGTNPRDYLTIAEREQIREAALEYGTVPAYGNLSPEERTAGRVT